MTLGLISPFLQCSNPFCWTIHWIGLSDGLTLSEVGRLEILPM